MISIPYPSLYSLLEATLLLLFVLYMSFEQFKCIIESMPKIHGSPSFCEDKESSNNYSVCLESKNGTQ